MWTGVTGWFVWNWEQPIYYDYGSNVYFEDNSVYINGEEAGTAEWYSEQMAVLANSVPADVTNDDVEWLPLGVFALVQGKDDEPNMFLQLAVTKEGIIGGTYENATTDSAQSVEGMVDKSTQRAAWTIGDNKNTVLETGVYNLTKDETSVLVHFGAEKTQQWLMVRLEEPPAEEGESGDGS